MLNKDKQNFLISVFFSSIIFVLAIFFTLFIKNYTTISSNIIFTISLALGITAFIISMYIFRR